MTDATDTAIIQDLLGEVKGYLPEMHSCLKALRGKVDDAVTVKELHRMTHTISGVAAMVQLTELSRSAGLMEDMLDIIMAGTQKFNVQLIDVMDETVQKLGMYCDALAKGDTGDEKLYQSVSLLFSNVEAPQQTTAGSGVDDFFAEIDDAEPAVTNDFFQELEQDNEDVDDDLENLFNELDTDESLVDSGFDELFAESDEIVEEKKAEKVSAAETTPPVISMDQELLECFNEEVEEHLENMGDQLNLLAEMVQAPSEKKAIHREALHSLRRSVHTMKGAAAVIGVESVAEWGHEFEDFLDWLHDESARITPEIINAMFEGADLLEKISSVPDGDYAEDVTRIQAVFHTLVHQDDNSTLSEIDLQSPEEDLGAELDSLFAATDENRGLDDVDEPEGASLAFDEELLECFREEVEEHLENIGDQLNDLSTSITQTVAVDDTHRQSLHSLRRSVHTLKGAAAVIGIEPVASWGHEFEDFLDWLHDESDALSPDIVSAMLEGADLLENIARKPEEEYGSEETAVKDIFHSIMQGRSQEASGQKPSVIEFNTELEEADSQLDSHAIDTELLEIFNVEAEEHLENISRKLNVLSTSITDKIRITEIQRADLHSLRRSVHDIKGAASVVGIKPLVDWGHEFEDFLDWLHGNNDYLSPEIVEALLEGAEILDQLAENLGGSVTDRQRKASVLFQQILSGTDSQRSDSSKKSGREIKLAKAFKATGTGGQRKKVRKKTLRVGVDKIGEVMGLSDDVAISLSTSENAMQTMQFALEELGNTLNRLKGIASSLEAGYELATIPHFGTPTEGTPGADGILEEFDPLEMDRYSELNVLIRSLNEAVVDLDSIRGQATDVHDDWRANLERQGKMLAELQSKMKRVQMTPFSTLANRLYRTVRESARVTGKSVRLVVEGGQIEMDSYVWDILADPLMHMLRNSVDHGIETQKERQAVGKLEQATIRIACSRRGNQFVLRLSDDGRGLDLEAIRQRALTLYPDLAVEQMSDQELAGLIFNQGFSIRTQVTQMSGRGVGMDVVRNAVDLLHGTIEVTTIANKGADFLFLLPITVAQLPALLISCSQEKFAVPMRDIARVLRLTKEESSKQTLNIDGDILPVLRPDRIMGLRRVGRFGSGKNTKEAVRFGVVVKVAGKRGVLVVDEILGNRELVFKSLGSHLRSVPCVAGVTIMGDGNLMPILHTEDLFNREKSSRQAGIDDLGQRVGDEVAALTVLAVDDSISIRRVLSKFITAQGWTPVLAVDGVDGLEKIREHHPDLVMLDVEMPRMNGFEVLQLLQSQSDLRDIPVLMLTSRSAEKYKDKARQLGARGFVTKPFDAEKLASLIIENAKKR